MTPLAGNPMAGALEFILVGVAAVAAGAVNALAGGGTLITFPMLTAVGVPSIEANVTNTVALCPGYLGATFAQYGDMGSLKRRLRLLLPASILGGVSGGILLLGTGERLFRMLVPFLILLASALLAVQEPVRMWLERRAGRRAGLPEAWAAIPVVFAAVYGGYFGAGLSVIVLSVLGLTMGDSLTRLNALKQVIALCTNVAAALFFVFSGRVVWPMVIVMAVGALAGGILGGKLSCRIKPGTLRWTIVSIGIAVALIYWGRTSGTF